MHSGNVLQPKRIFGDGDDDDDDDDDDGGGGGSGGDNAEFKYHNL